MVGACAEDARTVDDLQARIRDKGLEDTVPLVPTWGAQVDELFSECVEPKLIQPVSTRYWYAWGATRKVGALHRERGGVSRIVVDVLTNPRPDGVAGIFQYTYIDSSE